MRKIFGLLMAAALVSPAQAAPRVAPLTGPGSPAIPVEGGCGPGFHRNYEGHCRPNGWESERRREREEHRYERLECPRGYHLGEGGRRCWPN